MVEHYEGIAFSCFASSVTALSVVLFLLVLQPKNFRESTAVLKVLAVLLSAKLIAFKLLYEKAKEERNVEQSVFDW